MTSSASRPHRQVLLIGWDAADWNIARPLIEAGKMPALKRLMDGGVWGDLATIRPVLSPMLWTSIATGKRAWKHGIHGFSEPCPASGGIRPITNLSRKTKAVWNIFNQQGWRSNVIGWWPSYPAEPINGVMISNHFQQAVKNVEEDWPMRPGTVHPAELSEPLKDLRIHPAELGNEHILPFIPRAAEIDQEKDKRMASCAKILAEISSIHAAATACMQLEPWEFMAVYYDGIDHFGHGFMKYHPPRRPWIDEKDFELYQQVIEAAYRYHDMMLDVLLRIAGEDTTVMLISDHGFEPGNLRPRHLPNEPAGPAAEHSPYGIFALRGPGIKKGERIHGASLLDIAPTLLHLYGLPVGRDMDGKVLANCFEQQPEVAFIPSWDEVPGADGRHKAGNVIDPVEARESIKQLVDLGYIDEPNPDRAVAIDETVRELQYNLAQAYLDGGRYAEAARILRQQWDRWPEESRFGVNLINCHLALKDAVAARSAFETLMERKKRDTEVARAELKALTDRLRAETEEAKKAGTEPPSDRATQIKLRRLRGRAGANPQALRFLNASILTLEERYEEALSALPEVDQVPDDRKPSVLEKRGRILLTLRRWEESHACFQAVLDLDPRSADAHLGLARGYFGRQLYFDAAAEAHAALELQFHQPAAHLLYGRALLRLANARLAEQVLLTAVSQAPRFAAAHTLLAYAYRRRLNQPEKADEHLRLASEAKAFLHGHRHRLEDAESLTEASLGIESFPPMPTITGRLPGNPGDRQPLVVVSGLPRSGTSLMMQMLRAGGIEVVADDQRAADTSNPKGYFEDERVKRLTKMEAGAALDWLKEECGRAIKVVAPLLPRIPAGIPLKVIFMERAAGEVLRSQRSMLRRDGKPGGQLEDAAIARTFGTHLRAVADYCDKLAELELLPVSHADAIASPADVAEAVADFLGRPLNLAAMAAVVDPALHREKAL